METPVEIKKTNEKPNNVFQFPLNKRVEGVIIPPDFKLRQTKDYLNVVTSDISEAIVGTLHASGVNCDEEFKENMVIISLLLENVIYKTEGIEHDMDDVIENLRQMFYGEEPEEESEDN